MFKKFTNACVNVVQKLLPDAFIFCIVLTILVFAAAMPVSKMNPFEVANAWGSSMWSLLGFSMQMALVLVLGTALATAPLVKKAINSAAEVPKTPTSAIVFITVVSMIACWLNWGFGLVVGAILAKEIAKKVKNVDYRLLIASAYSGFVIWHAGFSGSIPLQLASYTDDIGKQTAGAVSASIPTSQTIFSAWNLIIVIAIIVVIAFVNAQMHPSPEDTVSVDPKLLVEPEVNTTKPSTKTPAEWLESCPLLSILTALFAIIYLIYTYKTKGSITLSLNVVNLIFLTLGIIFHGTPISYVNAITDAAKSAGGIILQFPFYAGIMGIMTATGPTGQSLAGAISDFFVNISNQTTFPVFTFLSAGIVNFFVPSGGGQWAVQAPIVMPAGNSL